MARPKEYVTSISPQQLEKMTLHLYEMPDGDNTHLIAQYRGVEDKGDHIEEVLINAVTGRVLRGHEVVSFDRKIKRVAKRVPCGDMTPDLHARIVDSWTLKPCEVRICAS